jgi:hypothetical protein
LCPESAALAVGQLSFLKFGHPAMPASIEREQLRYAVDFLAKLLHRFFHAGIGPRTAVWTGDARDTRPKAADSRMAASRSYLGYSEHRISPV